MATQVIKQMARGNGVSGRYSWHSSQVIAAEQPTLPSPCQMTWPREMPQGSHQRSSLICPHSCQIPSEPLPCVCPSPSDVFQMCEYDMKAPISKPLWTEAPAFGAPGSSLRSFPIDRWMDGWMEPSHITAVVPSSQRSPSFWQKGHQKLLSSEWGQWKKAGEKINLQLNPGMGLPWGLGRKESTCQCRRCRFDPRVRKIPWRRKWQPTPVLLPEKSHGQRSLADYSPSGHKRVGHNLAIKQQQQPRDEQPESPNDHTLGWGVRKSAQGTYNHWRPLSNSSILGRTPQPQLCTINTWEELLKYRYLDQPWWFWFHWPKVGLGCQQWVLASAAHILKLDVNSCNCVFSLSSLGGCVNSLLLFNKLSQM